MENIKYQVRTARDYLTKSQKINLRWLLNDLKDKSSIDDKQYQYYCKREGIEYKG